MLVFENYIITEVHFCYTQLLDYAQHLSCRTDGHERRIRGWKTQCKGDSARRVSDHRVDDDRIRTYVFDHHLFGDLRTKVLVLSLTHMTIFKRNFQSLRAIESRHVRQHAELSFSVVGAGARRGEHIL